MSYTLVIYDISDNSLRNKVAEICLRHGLYRIQKSAFVGRIGRLELKNLEWFLSSLEYEENDKVLILVVPNDVYERGKWITGGNRDTRYLDQGVLLLSKDRLSLVLLNL